MDGIRFDSKREAERYKELKVLEDEGQIRNLQRQVRFDLIGYGSRPITAPSGRKRQYVADFVYYVPGMGMGTEDGWKMVIEDAKGHRTEGYKLKRDIMATMGYAIVEV